MRFFENVPQEYWQFCEKEADWLDDFALFMALKEAHNGAQWSEWERPLKFREAEAIAKARILMQMRLIFGKCYSIFSLSSGVS